MMSSPHQKMEQLTKVTVALTIGFHILLQNCFFGEYLSWCYRLYRPRGMTTTATTTTIAPTTPLGVDRTARGFRLLERAGGSRPWRRRRRRYQGVRRRLQRRRRQVRAAFLNAHTCIFKKIKMAIQPWYWAGAWRSIASLFSNSSGARNVSTTGCGGPNKEEEASLLRGS